MSTFDSGVEQGVVCETAWEKRWDLGEVVGLDGGVQLIYGGERPLGKGNHGVVFPCNLKLGENDNHRDVGNVVVKCEKKEFSCRDGYEIRKWEKIPAHENLVKFYCGKVLEQEDSEHFGALLVFERMVCNLKELMFEDKDFVENCTYGDLVNILLQIVRGLIHLHGSGFLHMDLKLQNLLVSKGSEGDWLVKLGDIGESKAMKNDKKSVTATQRGTEAYMAPEILCAPRFRNSRKRITAHTDAYSLGVVMCVLFNKQEPPFPTTLCRGPVGREIEVGHFRSSKVFCQAPLELCDLIEQCLRFQISGLKDSREHGRPSFQEILSTLEEIRENSEWLSQKVHTKKDDCDIPAAIKACTAEVHEASPSLQAEEMDLFEAARRGNLGKAIEILESGENVNIQDRNLSTPLMQAAAHGNITVVKELLRRGARTNVANRMGASALVLAAGTGKLEVVEALLSNGAGENPPGSAFRMIALNHARKNGHSEIVQLLESGARVRQEDTAVGSSGLACTWNFFKQCFLRDG